MPKRSIPNIPKSSVGSDRYQFDVSLKETIEVIAGQRGERVKELSPTATNAQIIAKINELIALLQ
ncbi:hypothetical protein ACO0K3_03610 [Undibacterium sp. Rencai35W]|uniref:hypothetical protein n=1 Tax=Undibacterium sp. Rencai35W TaxID=3413046 RepID=UPI003BF170FF